MLVDTNIVLRWLLGDHEVLSKKAEKLVSSAPAGSLIVTDLVAAEIVYMLRGKEYDRGQISEALQLIERTNTFKFENSELMHEVALLFGANGLDFVDCYLWARSKREKTELKTFDNPLSKKYLSS